MFKMTNQNYIENTFRVTVFCEDCRFDADINTNKNAIEYGLGFFHCTLSQEELDLTIKKLQELKSMIIDYNKGEYNDS